jgi:hypothetical protein
MKRAIILTALAVAIAFGAAVTVRTVTLQTAVAWLQTAVAWEGGGPLESP